jgi:hypothetical protein
MEIVFIVAAFLGLWLLMQIVILPKLGYPT